MQLSIRIDGELVRKGLQDLSAEIPKVGRQQIRFTTERIVRRMQAYPGERPGQKYVRTGRLFRSWKIDSDGKTRYTIENTAARKGRKYGHYVVGDAYGTGQAWMHRGRWQLFRNVVDQEVAKLPEDVKEQILMAARRKGFETS